MYPRKKGLHVPKGEFQTYPYLYTNSQTYKKGKLKIKIVVTFVSSTKFSEKISKNIV